MKQSMQVIFHADHHTDGSQAMHDHLVGTVNDALSSFGERVMRVEAHLSDADGASRAGAGGIHCTLQASVKGAAPVVVKHQAGNAHQAIEGALRKLKRAVGTAVARQDSRRPLRQLSSAATDLPEPDVA